MATQLGHRLWSAVIARRVTRHRGITFSQCGRGLSPLGLFGSKTCSGQFQDDGMVDEPVDGGRRGHGILEDAIPLTEHEIATGSCQDSCRLFIYAVSPLAKVRSPQRWG